MPYRHRRGISLRPFFVLGLAWSASIRYTLRARRGHRRNGDPMEFDMKKDLHPEYHEITVVMTDGTEYKTRSTWGSEGDVLKLDIDPKSHPAWTGQHRILDSGGQVARFNKRFGSLGTKS